MLKLNRCVWRLPFWMRCVMIEESGSYTFSLPGVQVWNVDFRRQMVHQSSLCYKDLTLRHFVVSSTSVRCARVINRKSVCIMLCYCIQYVEIYTEERAFADINFLFSFEKTAAESYRLLRETYGEHDPSQDTCGR